MAAIVCTDDVLGGAPRIEDTRVRVLHVHELVAAGDQPPVDIADQPDLSPAQVYSALPYTHAHPAEIRQLQRDRYPATARR